MPEGNLYELLQVEPSAGLPEIRAAYRRLVLQYHPDRNPEADAQEMTQRLNRAYEVLSDPAQKAAYDWRLSGEPGRPPGWEDQERVDPSSGPRSGVRFFGGLPRSAWLAGTGAVAIAAVVVVVVVLAGGGGSNNASQTVQVIAPVVTPGLTPTIGPAGTGPTEGPTPVPPTPPPNPAFLFESGEGFVRNGDFERAIEEFTGAIDLIPTYGYGYQIRGDAYFQLAQFEAAILDYDKAIELDPNDKAAHSGRGSARYQLGQFEQAIDDFDQAIILDPRSASTLNRRGLAYRALEEFDLAKRDIDAACSLDSQFCSPLLSVAPTATPVPTPTPAPTATQRPPPTQPRGRRENFVFPVSVVSVKSSVSIRIE